MASARAEVELEKLTPELHLRLSKKVAQLTKVRVRCSKATYASRCPKLPLQRLRSASPGVVITHAADARSLQSRCRPYS
jgi:hypothetical protein